MAKLVVFTVALTSPSGAVVSSDLAVLIAEVRAFTAPERAASMRRTPSTHPSWLLGVPSLEPDIAARAALSASASSHFLLMFTKKWSE